MDLLKTMMEIPSTRSTAHRLLFNCFESITAIHEKIQSECEDIVFEYPEHGFEYNGLRGYKEIRFQPDFFNSLSMSEKFVNKLLRDKPDYIFYEHVYLQRDLIDDWQQKTEHSDAPENDLMCCKLYHRLLQENRIAYKRYIFLFNQQNLAVYVDGFHHWKQALILYCNDYLKGEDDSAMEIDEYDLDCDDEDNILGVTVPDELLKRLGRFIAGLKGFMLCTNMESRTHFVAEHYQEFDFSLIEHADKMDFSWHFQAIASYAQTHFNTVLLPEKVSALKKEGKSNKEIATEVGISAARVSKVLTALR